MKILVIGSGAREHALVWKLAQSNRVEKIYCAPGNPGIGELASCVPIEATDVTALLDFACNQQVDLTVPGPEAPLVQGIVDVFEAHGMLIFGPSKKAAALEGSKAYAKYIMEKYQVPTAPWAVFDDYREALAFTHDVNYPCVIKADGLAAGKGAVVVHDENQARETLQKMMVERVYGEAGEKVVIEAFLQGEEASVFAISDGERYVLLPAAQDHKAIFDGDKGPNTGGMGAYAPAPMMTDALLTRVREEIITPVLDGMAKEGTPYRGVLYAGLMITAGGPKVVEFNCRFGDPEAQVVLPLIKSDLAELMYETAARLLNRDTVQIDSKWALCVVMASGGYPGTYETGKKIIGLDQDFGPDRMIFHAGTRRAPDGSIVTAGGRVLSATAIHDSFAEARKAAYGMIKKIAFDGAYYRKDIGKKALKWLQY